MSYLTSDNRESCRESDNFRYQYTARNRITCCNLQAAKLMPYYVSNMWKKTDDGLVAFLYGPCSVNTTLGKTRVSIEEKTLYPMDNRVTLDLQISGSRSFKIVLREPSWSAGKSRVSAEGATISREDGFIILEKSYGFTSGQLAAPQANAMAAVIEPLMSGADVPWLLYGIGAAIALVLTFCGVPALAFALGMFIPLDLNLPLLVGGAINWYVTSRSKDGAVNRARGERGTLLASGFIAGGALMGVVSSAMRFGGLNFVNTEWLANPWSEICALAVYAVLIAYLVKASLAGSKGRL